MFVLGLFIYSWWFVVVLRLEGYLTLFPAHDQLSGAIYFSFVTDFPFIFDDFAFLISF